MSSQLLFQAVASSPRLRATVFHENCIVIFNNRQFRTASVNSSHTSLQLLIVASIKNKKCLFYIITIQTNTISALKAVLKSEFQECFRIWENRWKREP